MLTYNFHMLTLTLNTLHLMAVIRFSSLLSFLYSQRMDSLPSEAQKPISNRYLQIFVVYLAISLSK